MHTLDYLQNLRMIDTSHKHLCLYILLHLCWRSTYGTNVYTHKNMYIYTCQLIGMKTENKVIATAEGIPEETIKRIRRKHDQR